MDRTADRRRELDERHRALGGLLRLQFAKDVFRAEFGRGDQGKQRDDGDPDAEADVRERIADSDTLAPGGGGNLRAVFGELDFVLHFGGRIFGPVDIGMFSLRGDMFSGGVFPRGVHVGQGDVMDLLVGIRGFPVKISSRHRESRFAEF